MKLLKIRDIGSKGLVKDLTAHEYPEGYMSEALNVRFSQKGVLRVARPERVWALGAAGEKVWLSSLRREGVTNVYYATTDQLYMDDNGEHFMSVGGPYTASRFWHDEVYGRTMIWNSPENIPQVMEPDDTVFTDLPNWPASERATVIRSFKAFLVAIGIQEGSETSLNVVHWSNAAYNNQLPPDWDYNDPASFSGKTTLGPSDGILVDGAVLGDVMVIYAQRACYSMQFSGNVSFPMQFRELFKLGALNRNCIGIFERKHFVVGEDHIYVHDGVSVSRPAEGKVERAIYADMADRDTVRVVMNPSNYEALIYFRSIQNKNVAWVWNWSFNTWARIDLEPSTVCLHFGPTAQSLIRWSDWEADAVTWQSMEAAKGPTWDEISGKRIPHVMLELTNYVTPAIWHLFADFEENTAAPFREALIRREGIDLDSLDEFDSGVIKHIRRVYPIMTGDVRSVVKVRVAGYQSSNATPVYGPWQPFALDGGIKVDTRVSGRYLALEVQCDAKVPGKWGITGFDIEVMPAGGR